MSDYSDDYLMNTDNWFDFGLTDHLENVDKFDGWYAVALEAARILEAEDGSPVEGLLLAVAAASAKLGFGEDFT